MADLQRQFRSAFGVGSVDGVVARSLEDGVVVVVVLEGILLSLLGAAVVDVLDDMPPVLIDGVFAGGLSVTGFVALGVLVSTGLVD